MSCTLQTLWNKRVDSVSQPIYLWRWHIQQRILFIFYYYYLPFEIIFSYFQRLLHEGKIGVKIYHLIPNFNTSRSWMLAGDLTSSIHGVHWSIAVSILRVQFHLKQMSFPILNWKSHLIQLIRWQKNQKSFCEVWTHNLLTISQRS